ncbi:MAG TPA: glycosyltransferase family 87 protein [Chloroflexia bacterium]|nr:glycosyltransferase family 87 protein [Chloroflexia bacterium]
MRPELPQASPELLDKKVSSGQKVKRLRTYWPVLALLILVLPLFSWLNHRLITTFDYPNSDYTFFYAAGKNLLHGNNPYISSNTESILVEVGMARRDLLTGGYAYPLYTGYIFIPQAIFSLDWALTIWTVFNEMCLVVTIWLLLQVALKGLEGLERKQVEHYLVLATMVLYVPGRHFLKTLLDGQISIANLLLTTLFIYGLTFKRYGLAGIGLLAAVFKPTPYVLFLPVALLVLLPRERRRGLYFFVAGAVLLVASAFVINPAWPWQWLGSRTELGWKIMLRNCTIWGLTGHWGESTGQVALFIGIAAVLALSLVGAMWLAWLKIPAMRSNPLLFWGLLATLSYYAFIYAFSYEAVVLLIPLLGLLVEIRRCRPVLRWSILAGLALLMLILPWATNGAKPPDDEQVIAAYTLGILVFTWLVLLLISNQAHRTKNLQV